MKKSGFLLLTFCLLVVRLGYSQEISASSGFQWKAVFDPAIAGIQYDDNVYRSVEDINKLSDEIYSIDFGGLLQTRYDIFSGNFGYHLGDDQYQLYSGLNSLKNDFDFFLAADENDFTLYYKKEYFIRNSSYFDFNYYDDNNLVGLIWAPAGPWNFESRYTKFSRGYYNLDNAVQSQNYVDESGLLSVKREVDDRLSIKLQGSYGSRQFNRNLVVEVNPGEYSTSQSFSLQTDQTWTILLNTHLYFESILQDINLEEQRTNSNSYGFSNSVQSVSWAGIIRPIESFYLQLFFRLYLKTYDIPPLDSPDLRLGYIDEDSQDLLSVKASLEWSSNWATSLSFSRMRTESDQPDQYYIKNIISFQLRRGF